jgi:hypothetical protein
MMLAILAATVSAPLHSVPSTSMQLVAGFQNNTAQQLHASRRAALSAVTMTLPDIEFHEQSQARWIQDPDYKWNIGMHPDCTPAQLQGLRDMLVTHKGTAAYTLNDLPGYSGKLSPFPIDNTSMPEFVRPRRHSPRDQQFAASKIEEMLQAGIIRPRESSAPPEYATEYTCAAKKDEQGGWTDLRFCNDYRPLNTVPPLDRYPLPVPDDIFNTLGSAKVFSKIDLRAGFNQIPIKESDIPKTAFWFNNRLYMCACHLA